MPNYSGVIETRLEYWLGTDDGWDFVVWTTAAKVAIRDATGFTTSFMVKRKLEDADDDAVIESSGTVGGTFNASAPVNTQRIAVALVDTDTDTEVEPGIAFWELKRTDAGFEKPLAFGKIMLRRAVHVE